MCGVAGVARRYPVGVSAELLERMVRAIAYRGPDGSGLYADERVGLANVRLSVIDLARGLQPMTNEDGSVVVVYNGEIFDHLTLRRELEARGHLFRTRSDTEVLVHAYEQWGERMVERLNGQYAFAIYDRRAASVFLARDRFGIVPLYYAERDGDLYFASEIKALLASGEVERGLDPQGLDEVFTFWAARPPRTPFRGIRSLEPGCCARWRDGRLAVRRYYALDYRQGEGAAEPPDALEALDELMRSAVRLRLQADVPVGGYLSGGIDSSIVCALAAEGSPHRLRTFSVTFDDPRLDESPHQQAVAVAVRSRHAVQRIGPGDIARVFPDVVRHAETPLVRTAPAPLYLLSRLVREAGIKVVLSGEGSDELFLGYDLFKETVVRLLCWRRPASRWPPRLLDGLYPDVAPPPTRKGDFWRRYFLTAGSQDDPLFSHLPRFQLTARIKDFYAAEFRATLERFDPLAELRAALPAAFSTWSPLARAAYLEMTTLLSPYLLSSQGDRMAMAHGVEARVPFLDHRIFEFAAALPPRSKLRGLREKDILRRWARGLLAPAVARRRKQPYRAPDVPAFFEGRPPEYVESLLDRASVAHTGLFNPQAVAGLVRRCRAGRVEGFRESQALVAILSTQVWHHEFFGMPAAGHAEGMRRGEPAVVVAPPAPTAPVAA
ncbi:MAG TPA: asparagine synthase (glutamine-hydrolyzing) [Gemmatimonadales bacterium]|nr:asparagine synthase (glutamine-hydrolyzing) [Gemmatimonadales bacterium]